MKRLRGFTLIEMLVVIATGAALMAVAMGILHLLIRLEQGSREEVRRQTTLDRLAGQFRRDVHAAGQFAAIEAAEAAAAEVPEREDGTPGWQFSLDENRTVQYRAGQRELIRTERAEKDAVARESYVFPSDTTVSIDLVGEAAPGIVRLRVAPDGAQPLAIWRGTCVDAELAKDRRFLQSQEP
ncbi:MAG TPA: prepilin-type N-terminal cleavage/methylation domain-containing protein [Thermoguttaceae bacterium]|nr:prepilin-type N-terminal cleavage/methylation domain-containing protein [Thermoguttaceae bacterium]